MMKIVDFEGEWEWGLRWRIIPWKFRVLYCRTTYPDQETIWMEREWK